MSKSTDNEIMKLCQRDILIGSPGAKVEVLNFIRDFYYFNGQEFNNNFSFDNWKLVACWLYTFEDKDCTAIPVFGRHSWRVWDNLPFFVFARSPKIFFFLRPVLSFYMILSMLWVWRTDKAGNRYIDTDGKLISFYVTEVFGFTWTRKILDYIISKNGWIGTWMNIHHIYYGSKHIVMQSFVGFRDPMGKRR